MSKHLERQRKAAERQRRQRNQRILWIAGVVGVFLLIAGGLYLISTEPSYTVNPTDQQLVALGEQVYDSQCASCHGPDLEGEIGWNQPSPDALLKAPPHDETGHTWHHDNDYLVESIVRGGARLPAEIGISPMPAYDSLLTPREIGAVISYIQSQWPSEILARQSGN